MNTESVSPDLREVAKLLDLRAVFVSGVPYGSGHINDTYCATLDQAGTRICYILQRINTNVFKTPAALMDNIGRVTRNPLFPAPGPATRSLNGLHPQSKFLAII
jgi:hypothetical protein